MTNRPDDLIDPLESTLLRRVSSMSEAAVRPIDAGAIARATVAANPRRTGLGRLASWTTGGARMAWLGATGVLGVVVLGGVILASGSNNQPLVSPGSSASAAASTPVDCSPDHLSARVVEWDGAAGHRIATVALTNSGPACALSPVLPELIDSYHVLLIRGASVAAGTELAAGETVTTLVQSGNYCGIAAKPPVTIQLAFSAGFNVIAAPASASQDAPPCNGQAGPKDDIQMHPWLHPAP